MIQLYFLSILCNAVAGYFLFTGSDDLAREKTFLPTIKNHTFYLVLGILCAVTGVLKLLSPLPSGDPAREILIFGDFFPAVAGIVAGFIFIFGIYRGDTSETVGKLQHVSASLLALRKPIAMAILVITLVHFLFGRLLFL